MSENKSQGPPEERLEDRLYKIKPKLADVLPSHIKPEYVIRSVMLATSANPALYRCDPITILQAVMLAAQLGLDCSGAGGEAFLVPYGEKCQLIIGFQGLVDLARRSGFIRDVQATLVYADEADRFSWERGTTPGIKHHPVLGEEGVDREVIAAYAVAFFTHGGDPTFEVMDMRQIGRIRDAAIKRAGSRSSPWKEADKIEEMIRKCPTRRLSKYLPKSAEFKIASIIAGANEGGNAIEYDALGDYGRASSKLANMLALPESTAQVFTMPGNREPEGVKVPANVQAGIDAHERATVMATGGTGEPPKTQQAQTVAQETPPWDEAEAVETKVDKTEPKKGRAKKADKPAPEPAPTAAPAESLFEPPERTMIGDEEADSLNKEIRKIFPGRVTETVRAFCDQYGVEFLADLAPGDAAKLRASLAAAGGAK